MGISGDGEMDFYEVIEKRRTVRDFEPEEILDEDMEKLIHDWNLKRRLPGRT